MLGLLWAHDSIGEDVLDGLDPGRRVEICPDTQLTCLRPFFYLKRPVGSCHGLGNLLEATLNLVEATMTSTDLLEAILSPAEATMDLLEAILMSIDLLVAAMMSPYLLEAILNLLDQLEDILILCRH
jgi:hypothetical protein